MRIRKLAAAEWADFNPISIIAFHIRLDDIEKSRESWDKEAQDHPDWSNWGAFADDGTPMARVLTAPFTARFDGHVIKNGGVGAVSTLPEYRNTGAVRAIFREMLADAYASGEIISSLYPFNHAFYRKFGYETVCYANKYMFPVTALKGYKHEGWVKMWRQGETPELFTEVYNKFAEKYNLSFVRDDGLMSNCVRGAYYKDHHFCYLIGDEENGPTAYVVFDDRKDGDKHILNVDDMAYTGPCGLRSLLGFLARFTADYSEIWLQLPTDVELRKLVDDPYDIKSTAICNYMVRAINAPKLLALMKKPQNARFTIEILDDMLPVNTGTWLVDGESVTPTGEKPDVTVSERAFSQLALGISSLDEALFRTDVKLHSNAETLRAVFVARPAFIADGF
jgi:predicted acetyltransferase